jgi:hypothetical protein
VLSLTLPVRLTHSLHLQLLEYLGSRATALTTKPEMQALQGAREQSQGEGCVGRPPGRTAPHLAHWPGALGSHLCLWSPRSRASCPRERETAKSLPVLESQ